MFPTHRRTLSVPASMEDIGADTAEDTSNHNDTEFSQDLLQGDNLKRRMSMSASIDPYDDEVAPLNTALTPLVPRGRGVHHGRSHRRSRSEHLADIVPHFKVEENQTSEQTMMLLFRGESIEHSFDFSDLDARRSPKSPKARPPYPSSAQMLSNAGMRPLVGELLADLDTDTDGLTNSSSSLKVDSFNQSRGVEERIQAVAALEQASALGARSNDSDMSVTHPRDLSPPAADLKLSPLAVTRTKINVAPTLGVSFRDTQHSHGEHRSQEFSKLFESGSMSMDPEHAGRLALSSRDWADIMPPGGNSDVGSPSSPIKSPRCEEDGEPPRGGVKKPRPNDQGLFSPHVQPLLNVQSSSPSTMVSDLVDPVKVLSIQQKREGVHRESDSSSATLRMDAHLSGETLPPAPVPPAGYIQEIIDSRGGFTVKQETTPPAAAPTQGRISDTVYHRPASGAFNNNSNNNSNNAKSRGKYKCGRCGAPKVNHVCEFMEGSSVATQVELQNGYASNVTLTGKDKVISVGARVARPGINTSMLTNKPAGFPKPTAEESKVNPKNAVHYMSGLARPPVYYNGADATAPPAGVKEGRKSPVGTPDPTTTPVPKGMMPITTPVISGRFLQSRIGSAELPPLFSAPLGIKDTPPLDTSEKARPINFAHSFDILDMPPYDPNGMVSLSHDDFDAI